VPQRATPPSTQASLDISTAKALSPTCSLQLPQEGGAGDELAWIPSSTKTVHRSGCVAGPRGAEGQGLMGWLVGRRGDGDGEGGGGGRGWRGRWGFGPVRGREGVISGGVGAVRGGLAASGFV
jgi:hypothetical protein